MRRRPRVWVVAVALGITVASALTSVAAAQPNPKQRLARAYSPIVNLRAQEHPPCDTAEEQYRPTTVDVVLGNPEVRLIAPPDVGEPVVKGPTAAEIAGLGEGYHLDLPGDPLEADCTYARDFRRIEQAGNAPPVAYAHIRRQPGESGLVVQYWFYYYFNQFNDVHESDWEGMQIVFGADTAERALAEGPSEIGLFQHGGGERAEWNDERVQKHDTHPVIYSAAGSHATFYDSAVYIENGRRGSGLGCDNTSDPLDPVEVRPILVPTKPAIGGRFQWLTYEGRWGQKEDSFNNGPSGPNTKPQWLRPFATQASLRTASVELPGGALVGPAVTSAFCGTVAGISGYINLAAQSRPGAIALALIALLIVVVPIFLTTWRPVELEPLRQPRAFGQLIRGARQFYGRHWRPLVALGLSAVPIVGLFEGLRWLLDRVLGGSDLVDSIGTASFRHTVDGSIVAIGTPVGLAIVSAAVIVLVREAERGRELGFLDAYRGVAPVFWRVALARLIADALVLLMVLTVILIPVAVRKFVDWQFVQQEILFGDRSLRDAFRASSSIVLGRWWHTVRVAGFLWLVGIVSGPVLGFALVFADLPPHLINLLGSAIFALLIPYIATGRTLLYFDLVARPVEPASEPVRRWRLPGRRPSPQPG